MFTNRFKAAMLASLAAVVVFAAFTGQQVYAQSQSSVADYTGLFQAIGGLVAAIVALAGLGVQALNKMNEKMHLVDQAIIDKATAILNTIKDTDLWSLENEQRLTAVLTFLYNTNSEAKKYMDDHAIDVKKLTESSEETKRQIEELYQKLMATATASALKK